MESNRDHSRTYGQEEAASLPGKDRTRYPPPAVVGPDYHLSTSWTKSQQKPAPITILTKPKATEGANESTTSSSTAATFTLVPEGGGETSTDESLQEEEPLEVVEEGREAARATTSAVGDAKPAPASVSLPSPQPLETLVDQPQSTLADQPQSTTAEQPQQQVPSAPETESNPELESYQLDNRDPEQALAHDYEQKPRAQEQPVDAAAAKPEDSGADDLVQATLIRDVDESSDHSDADLMPPLPQTILTRDTTTGAITVESDLAVVEAKPVEPVQAKTMSRKLICAVMFLLLLVIAALSVGFVVSAQRQGDSNEQEDESSGNTTVIPTVTPLSVESASPTATPIPVLQRLKEEGGVLKCGVIPGPGLFYYNEEGEPAGFDAALCAAVAAAATGDPKNVEYRDDLFQNSFLSLKHGEVDLVAGGITHTMERQVYESSSKTGFAFTVPYLYQGMQLAGNPTLVDCGDQGLEYIAACTDIRVCVVNGSTHQQMLSSYLPGQKLIPIDNREALRESLADGTCNIIAHEGYNLAESLIRSAGYEGPYKVGRTLFSKEPLAMITATDDPQFSDFANGVVQALVVAEANNITQSTASTFEQTDAFGEEYKDMFRNAIAAGGNYGELYEEFLQPYSKRQGLNLINFDDSTTTGLLYSHPFGSISSEEGEARGMLLEIRRRDSLRCGVRPNRVGFAELEFSNVTGEPRTLLSSSGLEVDYCRALAGSIFEAVGDKVDFVEVLDEKDGFAKLAAGDLDVLAGATWSFPNEVRVPEINEGFTFSQPYFYGNAGGIVEEENLCLATRQDDHLWSSFVYWTSAAIVQAEEINIDQGMSNSMPPIHLFGEEFSLCFQDAILTVGNQKEMYDRNLEALIPRSGRNLPNGNVGPQMYPIPGLQA